MKQLNTARKEQPFSTVAPDVGEANYCDKSGAAILKTMIEEYWRARGHEVTIWLDDNGFHAALRTARFDVRSDMINGLPRPACVAPAKAVDELEDDVEDWVD